MKRENRFPRLDPMFLGYLQPSLAVALHFNARVYNTFVLTALSYLGQVCEIPDGALASEAKALRKMAPGPGHWCTAQDLYNLDAIASLPVGFGSVRICSWASRSSPRCYSFP